MSQPTAETPGNTEGSSCENSGEASKKDSLFLPTVFYVLTRPGCVLFMGISWFHLYSLCRFGRLHRNVPILLLCLLWWVGAVIYGVHLWRSYERGRQAALPGEFDVEDRRIKWFVRKKDTIRFFLKDKRVFTLDLSGLGEETKGFLFLKLSAVSFFGKRCWRVLAGVLILAMTALGVRSVVKSAMPWQGKLGNYLNTVKDRQTVELVHDNIYEDGIEGVFYDIRTKIALPDTLCLATSFNLHFAPEGKILTLDTMLYGFDAEGHFVDSYLITYNAGRSNRVSVYLHGAKDALYQEEKDLVPLTEAISLIPLEQALQRWEGEDCYGILYYGKREWNDREGIHILAKDGTSSLPPKEEYYFYGYSISLFCPENEQLTPLRYLYPDYISQPHTGGGPYLADYYPVEGTDPEGSNPAGIFHGENYPYGGISNLSGFNLFKHDPNAGKSGLAGSE